MSPTKIDVHTHIVPPFWSDAVAAAGKIPIPPTWNEEEHLELMERCNIAKSIFSITHPGTHLIPGDFKSARDLARRCNKFSAEVKQKRPDKFGYFAALPLPDVEGALAEIDYAFDKLQPDGVCVLTSHDGIYLGDPQFDLVFEELNRRKAKVFIHPTVPCITHDGCLISAIPTKRLPQGICEYFFEEARVIFNLLMSHTPSRFPDIRFIIPHAGGAFPPIVERFARFGKAVFGNAQEVTSLDIKHILQEHFYFDLTGFVLPDQIHGLLRFTGPDRLLFGSDYPYTRYESVVELAVELESELGSVIPNEKDRHDVYEGNAKTLFGDTL
ncbi:hypothetical protein PV08_01049 [Exophiala spinifera]|uniref:6-methylsalicylate decarboxylase n=1 Tax=Exophiala spinifera TaxID=91928 RepID=A0A0D2CA91_9EURO|nr:uncharacterized protein PV08_01049 [Exophiala spinifera]KIW20474.1 hypothetical protein PV08_01049 [Exophiala spinifera]